MQLTREEAIRLHREMWSDMKEALGERPPILERIDFKDAWCEKNFPGEVIESSCFLCDYLRANTIADCETCPIDWGRGPGGRSSCCSGAVRYDCSTISDILALPERKIKE